MLTRTIYFLFVSVFIIVDLCLMTIVNPRNSGISTKARQKKLSLGASTRKVKNTKYILQWVTPFVWPFFEMNKSFNLFEKARCRHVNCYMTIDPTLLTDIMEFSAVVFMGPLVTIMNKTHLPKKRSPNQIYIFASDESSHNFPVCSPIFDGFFNWTMTYRLDSDVHWRFIAVRDKKGRVVGPKIGMHWISDMQPVSRVTKSKLQSKKRAAAWFVSNCHSIGQREELVKEVAKHLKSFALTVDIYGECGSFSCPQTSRKACLNMVREKYYFYFAFENSFDDDYVTEKLLYAMMYDTVPVVYGAANYTRFMPDGTYLDGRALGAEKLAQTMNEIINDPEKYYSFFKYQNHYSYSYANSSPDTNGYCELCALLNDEAKLRTSTTVYKHFSEWWSRSQCMNNNYKGLWVNKAHPCVTHSALANSQVGCHTIY